MMRSHGPEMVIIAFALVGALTIASALGHIGGQSAEFVASWSGIDNPGFTVSVALAAFGTGLGTGIALAKRGPKGDL